MWCPGWTLGTEKAHQQKTNEIQTKHGVQLIIGSQCLFVSCDKCVAQQCQMLGYAGTLRTFFAIFCKSQNCTEIKSSLKKWNEDKGKIEHNAWKL